MKLVFKPKLSQRIKQPLEVQKQINYSLDFISGDLTNGRRVRILNIMDDFSKECLAAYADYCMESIVVLDHIVSEREKPTRIKTDNGPKFISKVLNRWCEKMELSLQFIEPRKSMQKGCVERLNSTFREDVLNAFLFETLEQLRILYDEWVYDYNNMKPNSALRSMSPSMIAKNNRILTIQLN